MILCAAVFGSPASGHLSSRAHGDCPQNRLSTADRVHTDDDLILLVVLLPLIVVISVAASQFTSADRPMQLDTLTESLDDAKNQFGLGLVHPEKFRRLDRLADSLDAPVYRDNEEPPIDESVDENLLLARITEAKSLVVYLDHELTKPSVQNEISEPRRKRTKP